MENSVLEVASAWAERVIVRLKGGDKAKLAKFHSTYVASNNKQIKIREEEVLELEERIVQAREEQSEMIETIDFESIGTIDERKKYVEVFRVAQLGKMRELDSFKESIDTKEEEIVLYKRLNSDINTK
jgi:hypothetical protein